MAGAIVLLDPLLGDPAGLCETLSKVLKLVSCPVLRRWPPPMWLRGEHPELLVLAAAPPRRLPSGWEAAAALAPRR